MNSVSKIFCSLDFSKFPNNDRDWSEDDWMAMINWLIELNFVSAREITALVLSHLNPSQVGTSIASKKTFQKNYPPRKTMQAVMKWHISQTGKCADCGTRFVGHPIKMEVKLFYQQHPH